MEFEAPDDYQIRMPTLADAAAMARVHVAVWLQTYPGMMSQDHLDSLDPANFQGNWERNAERANTPDADGVNGPRTVIAEHLPTSQLVGFACSGPARDPDAPTPQELWAINVLADHHGVGLADALLAASIADRPGYLWVVKQNARAQAFYRRHGFEADGTEVHEDRLDADEIRMVRL